MQRRLLISMLAVAVTAVLLLGVPLAFVLVQQQNTLVAHELQHDAQDIAKYLQQRAVSGLPSNAAVIARSLGDQYVVVRQFGGPTQVIGT